MNLFSKMKRPGAVMAGIFALALGSAVLLRGAGPVPVENFAPQGPMQSDLNAGGHNLTNIATVSATNVTVSGTLTAPVAVSGLTGAGTGVTSALTKAVNAPSGLVVQSPNGGVLMNVPLVKVNSAATTVLLVGDSTTEGAGVTDARQGPAPLLSTLGFCIGGSTVYRWGWIAWTTGSINSINATSAPVNYWTGGTVAPGTGTISPATLAAPYVIIDAGTNDYFGVYLSATLSTSSPTVTVSRNYYFSDGAGHQRVIAAGDKVAVYSGSGVLAANTTVASTTSTTITLSANPTTSGAVLLKVEPTPTSSTYHTDLANLISNAHTSNASAKVFVATLRPANNTATPADGIGSQGDFQDNVPVYNAYIRGMALGGGGANPDGIIDEAAMPEFATFNAAYYYTDQLHPNFAGNQAIARAENAALLGVLAASNLVMQAGSESTPDSSLSNNVALVNQTNTFTVTTQVGSLATGGNANLNLYGNETLSGSPSNGSGSPTLTVNAAGSGYTSTIAMTWGGSFSNSNIQQGVANGSSAGIPYDNISYAGTTSVIPISIYGNNLSNGQLIGEQIGKYNSPPGWYVYEYFIPGGSTATNVGQFGCGGGGFCQYGNGPCVVTNGSTSNNGYQLEIEGLGTEKVDSTLTVAGAISSTATLTTVNGSTAGTATFTEPFQGASYKKVIVELGSTLSGTASYTFPTAFANTPLVVNNDAAVTSVSATAVTVTGTLTLPRTVVLEGF